MGSQVQKKPVPSSYQHAAGPSPPQMMSAPSMYGHSRTRTTSSQIFPTSQYPPQPPYQPLSHQQPPQHLQQQQQQQQQQQPQQPQYPANMQVHSYTSQRTPSNATFATMSSGNGPVGFRPSTSQDLRRSTSSRSAGLQPGSYVALMRKQKATVWCDRAQHEDPRLLAQQKAAKIRATMEVVGKVPGGRVSNGGSASLAGSKGVTAKIRHHGKAGLVGYSPGGLVGGVGGVPMRLSASEVENGDSDDDDAVPGPAGQYHRRTGSGRSSVGSGRRGLVYSRPSGAGSMGGRRSTGNSPPGERQDSMGNVGEVAETPVAATHPRVGLFSADGPHDGTRSAGSGSSGERADAVSELDAMEAGRLASSKLKSTITREKSVRTPDELRRRGSVDERTMTLSAGRLYIANPDADSD